MANAIIVPTPFIDELNAWREKHARSSMCRWIPKKVTVAEPDEAKLKETYENNKAKFFTPEHRKVAVLLHDAGRDQEGHQAHGRGGEDLLRSDEKDTYDQPERRRLQQIAFKDKPDRGGRS